jgi:hypothetical protein
MCATVSPSAQSMPKYAKKPFLEKSSSSEQNMV